jgi:tellurium resistance protein TerD
MGINLQKGQKISLEKDAPGLSKVIMGLGWDINKTKKPSGGGFFSKLFSAAEEAFDLDAACIMLTKNGKFENMVYFSNLRSPDGSITHTGDNLTGEGEGDDEQIIVDLKNVPANIHTLVFAVTIYKAKERKQDFGQVQNAFVRMVNEANNQEIAKFSLSSSYPGMTSMIMAELTREDDGWKMSAVGSGSNAGSLHEVTNSYK